MVPCAGRVGPEEANMADRALRVPVPGFIREAKGRVFHRLLKRQGTGDFINPPTVSLHDR
jgi:hypothetical protein